MGLPGAGKTTLARALERALQARQIFVSIIDGDTVRTLWQDVDFSEGGRVNQANRIGNIADDLVDQGCVALCSFVCPTPDARYAFWGLAENGDYGFTVLVDRIVASAYPDTNRMFVPPAAPDYVVGPDESVDTSVSNILAQLGLYVFDAQKPTAMLVGRFQPFHEGHKALVVNAIADVGQVMIGLRDTEQDDSNPFTINQRFEQIDLALADYKGKYTIVAIPNVTKIVYGRTPGYDIEQYQLSDRLEAVSGTRKRKELGL
jgi:cytidyltransferase-like protein